MMCNIEFVVYDYMTVLNNIAVKKGKERKRRYSKTLGNEYIY